MQEVVGRIEYSWRAAECLGGLYQPQVGRRHANEVSTEWRNVGKPTRDQFAAEDAAKAAAEAIAFTF